ncbi:MAG: hypothetical protein AAF635_09055, partial [Cyanobacteria bacterium P01_C01_bin.69]
MRKPACGWECRPGPGCPFRGLLPHQNCLPSGADDDLRDIALHLQAAETSSIEQDGQVMSRAGNLFHEQLLLLIDSAAQST